MCVAVVYDSAHRLSLHVLGDYRQMKIQDATCWSNRLTTLNHSPAAMSLQPGSDVNPVLLG